MLTPHDAQSTPISDPGSNSGLEMTEEFKLCRCHPISLPSQHS